MITDFYDRPARTPLRSGDTHQHDPFDEIDGIPPNMGQDVLPHVVTFQGLLRNVSRTYYVSDEAVKDSWDNARFMRNDPGIMECLEQRQRSTALLGWHLEAEDEKDATQKYLVDQTTAIIRQIPNFLKYRENLLHALWYGKYGVAHRYRWKQVKGRTRCILERWRPVNGDKLVFRYDDGTGEFNDDQVGIRVGAGYTAGSQLAARWTVERIGKVAPTDYGLAYFLEPWERALLAIHKHMIEDGEYEAPDRAGAIHGVGIRNRLYWLWYQKQETLAWLMEYLERSAFGIEIWSYPAGNNEAFEKTKKAAQERIGNGRNIVLVPRHPDSDILSSDVKRIEPGMAGAEVLDRIIREYFGHQIKRYILGQILTSEAASTGLGSGVASIHLDTYLQIIRYDATNLSETLTTELVKPLIAYNWPKYAELPIRFVIETETPDLEAKLGAWKNAYEMGLRIRSQDVYDLIGAAEPQPDEDVLEDPQHVQAEAQRQQMQQQGQQQAAAQQQAEADKQNDIRKLFAILNREGYGKIRPGMERVIYDRHGNIKAIERYGADSWKDQLRDEKGRWTSGGTPGDTKNHSGRLYKLDDERKWRRVPSNKDPSPAVVVTGNELGSDLSPEQIRKRVHVYWKGRLRGRTFVNEETGQPIKIARSGIKELVARSADIHRLLLVPRLPKLLRLAVYSYSEGPHKANPKYDRFHHLLSEALIAGKEYDVDLLVGEDSNGNWFYQFPQIIERERPASKQAPDESSSPTASEPSTTGIIDPDEGEVKRNSRERYRAVPKKTAPGNGTWKTVGGSPMLVGSDGTIHAGCPGVKGENLDNLGEDEHPENRRRREHRQDVAEKHGIEGHEVTAGQARALEEHPHPETGKDVHGRQKAATNTKRVTLGDREYEVKYDGAAWFFRADPLHGWTQASQETAAAIEKELGDVPFDIPEVDSRVENIPSNIPGNQEPGDRKAKINPRTRVGKAILETAQDWGVPPDDLADALEYVWERRLAEDAGERQRGLEAARKLTGLYPSDVKKLKNLGFDHTSAAAVGGNLGQKLAHFDEFAQEVAREYPILGLGNPDDSSADFAAALWQILDEDRAKARPMDDPGLLREAAQLVEANRGGDYGEAIGATYEEFRRHGEVVRYRKWLVKRYAKEVVSERIKSVEAAAAETDTHPSEAEKEAGNYRKGKCHLFGLEVAIENPKGSIRSGVDRNTGKPWFTELPYHYGYIKRTESEADGDHIDVFLGPYLDSDLVFVIDQVCPGDGGFDEHKVMIGWKSAEQAKAAYHRCYQDGWKGFESITPMTIPAFKNWLESGDSSKRISGQLQKYARGYAPT